MKNSHPPKTALFLPFHRFSDRSVRRSRPRIRIYQRFPMFGDPDVANRIRLLHHPSAAEGIAPEIALNLRKPQLRIGAYQEGIRHLRIQGILEIRTIESQLIGAVAGDELDRYRVQRDPRWGHSRDGDRRALRGSAAVGAVWYEGSDPRNEAMSPDSRV